LPSSPVPTGASGAVSTEDCMFSSSLSLFTVSSFFSTCAQCQDCHPTCQRQIHV
jgi:hypothetical protein